MPALMFTVDLTPENKHNSEVFYKTHSQLCYPTGTGAIGGGFSYCFTPTSLGHIVHLKCNHCNEEIDLTDYNSF